MSGKRVVKLTQRLVRLYQKITGSKEVRCAVCGKMLHVGDKVVKHGKVREPMKFKKYWRVFFECAECWEKRFYDFEEPTEEEVERGEVLTVPFLILDEVMLK